jgi:hypothetical protein
MLISLAPVDARNKQRKRCGSELSAPARTSDGRSNYHMGSTCFASLGAHRVAQIFVLACLSFQCHGSDFQNGWSERERRRREHEASVCSRVCTRAFCACCVRRRKSRLHCSQSRLPGSVKPVDPAISLPWLYYRDQYMYLPCVAQTLGSNQSLSDLHLPLLTHPSSVLHLRSRWVSASRASRRLLWSARAAATPP